MLSFGHMNRKFVLVILIVVVVAGGYLYWQTNTTASIEQTKEENQNTLPVSSKNNPSLPASDNKKSPEAIFTNTFFTVLKDDNIFVAKEEGSFNIDGRIQIATIIEKFFAYYPDQYDFIAIFTTYPSPSGADYGYVVNNTIQGIGNVAGDQSKMYGSKGTLKGVSLIHDIPLDKRFSDLGHELSHYWIMYVQNTPDFSINRDGSHWSNWLDTATREGGFLYYDPNGGNAHTDNGDGTFSVDSTPLPPGPFTKFSSISLYLMGLLPSSEVRPLVLWETLATPGSDVGSPPMVGVKKIVTVDDIIKIAGPRIPAYPNTQRNFKIAYILLPKNGETATESQIESIQWIAANFPQEWNRLTGGRSSIR